MTFVEELELAIKMKLIPRGRAHGDGWDHHDYFMAHDRLMEEGFPNVAEHMKEMGEVYRDNPELLCPAVDEE